MQERDILGGPRHISEILAARQQPPQDVEIVPAYHGLDEGPPDMPDLAGCFFGGLAVLIVAAVAAGWFLWTLTFRG